jgi:hypothetical protein
MVPPQARRQSPPAAAAAAQIAPPRPVFGVSLSRLYERDGLAVPMVVYQCIQAVDLFGLNVEGIYRLSGSVPHVNKLKTLFDTGTFVSSPPSFRILTLCRLILWQPRFPQPRKLLSRREQRRGFVKAVLPRPARPDPDQGELLGFHRSSQYVPSRPILTTHHPLATWLTHDTQKTKTT